MILDYLLLSHFDFLVHFLIYLIHLERFEQLINNNTKSLSYMF